MHIHLGEAVYSGYFPSGIGDNSYLRSFFTEYFQERNNQRAPAYHRFDIGVNFSKQKRLWKRTWSFWCLQFIQSKQSFFPLSGYGA